MFGAVKAATEWSISSVFGFLMKLFKAISAFLKAFNEGESSQPDNQVTPTPRPISPVGPLITNIISVVIDRVFRARGTIYGRDVKDDLKDELTRELVAALSPEVKDGNSNN